MYAVPHVGVDIVGIEKVIADQVGINPDIERIIIHHQTARKTLHQKSL